MGHVICMYAKNSCVHCEGSLLNQALIVLMRLTGVVGAHFLVACLLSIREQVALPKLLPAMCATVYGQLLEMHSSVGRRDKLSQAVV